MSKEKLNIIEKQKIFNEYIEMIKRIGEMSPAQQLRATLGLEDYLASIYEKGYQAGVKDGIEKRFDILKN